MISRKDLQPLTDLLPFPWEPTLPAAQLCTGLDEVNEESVAKIVWNGETWLEASPWFSCFKVLIGYVCVGGK